MGVLADFGICGIKATEIELKHSMSSVLQNRKAFLQCQWFVETEPRATGIKQRRA